jgi:hypothetical protein
MFRFLVGVVALVLVVGAGRANANLITNGDFESTFLDQNNHVLPTDWTSGNLNLAFSHIQTPPPGGFADPDGGQNAMSLSNLSFNGFATIQETINTVNGTTYNLSYWFYSTAFPTRDNPAEFQVLWNGVVMDDLVNPQQSSGWVNRSLQLTGTGHDTLEFAGFNNPGFNFLDDVNLDGPSAAVVPEPGSLTLFGLLGTFGLFGYAWRRRFRVAA